MPQTYWLENVLPSKWTPIGDRGTEYRFVQIPDWPVWDCFLREWVPRYGNWAEMKILVVQAGMTEDYIRRKLFEAVYAFEKAYS